MHESIAQFVHPVLEHGLDLRRRVEAGETASIEVEQATLEDLIRREPEVPEERSVDESDARRPTSARGIEDIRYALTCWLDELFILASPWDEAWSESKLEARLFDSNDRAWRFWERSAAAEQMARPDALEVFYLCVALGFRGELSEGPDQLQAWIDRTRRRLSVLEPRPEAAALEPPCDVPPLRGLDRFRRVAFLAGCVAIFSIPALVLIFGG